MAAYITTCSYGTHLASNSTALNYTFTTTLCVAYDITTFDFTSNAPPRISSRLTSSLSNQLNFCTCGCPESCRTSFWTTIYITFLMASNDLIAILNQLDTTTDLFIPGNLTYYDTNPAPYFSIVTSNYMPRGSNVSDHYTTHGGSQWTIFPDLMASSSSPST